MDDSRALSAAGDADLIVVAFLCWLAGAPAGELRDRALSAAAQRAPDSAH